VAGAVICLDTNYLIGGVSEERPESRHLMAWAAAGESFCTAAPAWYEFLCGPVQQAQIGAMRAFLKGGVLPFDDTQAVLAARLYNGIGRPRRLRVDVMIAAVAIGKKAPLATLNANDFKPLIPYGLELVSPL
jgi:predicted nucleic acid-binding protein